MHIAKYVVFAITGSAAMRLLVAWNIRRRFWSGAQAFSSEWRWASTAEADQDRQRADREARGNGPLSDRQGQTEIVVTYQGRPNHAETVGERQEQAARCL